MIDLIVNGPPTAATSPSGHFATGKHTHTLTHTPYTPPHERRHQHTRNK